MLSDFLGVIDMKRFLITLVVLVVGAVLSTILQSLLGVSVEGDSVSRTMFYAYYMLWGALLARL